MTARSTAPIWPMSLASTSTTCSPRRRLDLLGFATVEATGVALTDTGLVFAQAAVQDSKQLFATAALDVPLIRLIVHQPATHPLRRLRLGFFGDLLAHHYTSEQVTRQLDTATDWAATPSYGSPRRSPLGLG
jgi:hypothetical protein